MASVRNFSKLSAAAGLLFIGLPIAGCVVETESPPGPQFKYPALSDFCVAVSTAECNSVVVNACYNTVNADDTSMCQGAVSASCNQNPLPYHPQQAEACLAAITAQWADAATDRVDQKATNDACLPVFNKAGPAGSTCAADADCDALTGLRCVAKSGAAGICETPVVVMPGNSCSADNAVCTDGFYCDTKHCVSAGMATDSCSDTAPCAPQFSCSGPASGKTCISRLADGKPCSTGDDCTGGFCLMGNGKSACSSVDKLDFLSDNCDAFR